MKPKNFISILCLLVLMFQVLPVKELGNLLFSNQLQEEVPHTSDGDAQKDTKAKLSFQKDFCCTNGLARLNFVQAGAAFYLHFASALPAANAGEIQTPPPNMHS